MAHILIMEDDVDQAYELSNILTEAGHDVIWRSNAADARAALETERFDLLIADIYVHRRGQPLPDGGISLIGWMRNAIADPVRAWMAEVPVIAISGAVNLRGNEYILNIARSIGATATMAKPIVTEELCALVSEQLVWGEARATI
ncbi:MAG: response regulator [Pseudomonadota bacterium]